MLRIKDLMEASVFKEFKLISGTEGLNNIVLGTGIFEWESFDDIEKNFLPGEFVVTTLSQGKEDIKKGENSIKMLILKGVSGIGIKTVYISELSEEIKDFASYHKVPIFMFSGTYFDDIIFYIKNQLMQNETLEFEEFKIKKLFLLDENEKYNKELCHEINPLLYENIICVYITKADGMDIKNRDLILFKEKLDNEVKKSKVEFSLLKFMGGVIIIYSEKNISEESEEEISNLILNILPKETEYCFGIGNFQRGIVNTGKAFKESIYAHTCCIMDKLKNQKFDDIGIDQLLMPVYKNKWAVEYYTNIMEKISLHDKNQKGSLLETLVAFVECNGDINTTGKILFQHGNTVRYRLEKIKTILKIDKNKDYYPQLYSFIRLHKINILMDKYYEEL